MAAGEAAQGPARWRGGSSEPPSVHQGTLLLALTRVC